MTSVVVVGAGVIGLTTARELAERGHDVRIVAAEPTHATTSAVTGAVWLPYRVFPQEKAVAWAAATRERLKSIPAVRQVELLSLGSSEPWWRAALPPGDIRPAADLPPGYDDGLLVRVPLLENPGYLEWLAEGLPVERRRLRSLDEVDAEVVVNCSGVGARELGGDSTVAPVRGQVAYAKPVPGARFVADEAGPNALAYVIPRRDVTVLGGTAEEGEWSREPEPDAIAAILERCAAIEPRVSDAEIVGTAAGLRPGRPEVRLERDGRVIHNYGHGGGGFTLSWGCARDVAALVGHA